MDVATHDAVVEKLIREKMAVEGDLRDARQRAAEEVGKLTGLAVSLRSWFSNFRL